MTQADRTPRPMPARSLLLVPALLLSVPTAASDVPFVPTPEATVQAMLEVVQAGPGDIVYDLGSGDGRIVIAAVRDFGVERAVGIDINRKLVEESRGNAESAGVADRATFKVGDIFEEDFSDATVITMYLLHTVNMRLRPRLLTLRPGTRLVSHRFHMDDWEPDVQTNSEGRNIYHWIVPANVAGTWRWQAGGEGFRLDLQQAFQNVAGTLTAYRRAVPIESVSLSGDAFTFAAHTSDGDQPVHLRFSGRIENGVIKAQVAIDGPAAAVRVERVEWSD
jgi:SAM-dependent methyltransferase